MDSNSLLNPGAAPHGEPQASPPVVSLSIDMPLHLEYDMRCGELTIDTPLVNSDCAAMLRLRFSPAAAAGFANALAALADRGCPLGGESDGLQMQ